MRITTLILILFSVAYAEKIYLKNGDVLTGEVLQYEENSAIIKTSYGEITIARDQIVRIEFETESDQEQIQNIESELQTVDTLTHLVIDKTGHLSPLSDSWESFQITDPGGKLVIIVSNEQSYNALTDMMSGELVGLVTSMAFGIPLPVDLSGIEAGKDFGYQIHYWEPRTNAWCVLTSSTKTIFEHRVIDLDVHNYTNWSIHFDNTFSVMTPKNYKLQAYVVRVKEE